MNPPPVVVGGGFAGLAAACRLAGDGARPLLLERAPRWGGRASSYWDPIVAEEVDYGHHVLMRCCEAAMGFLHRIGQADAVRFAPSLSVPLLCGGRRSPLRSRPLPGPLHLLPSLLHDLPLTWSQRFRALRAAATLWTTSPGTLDEITFDAWLSRHRQDARIRTVLWDPVVIATLNAPARCVSAASAQKVFVDGVLQRRGAGVGLFRVPLSQIASAAAAYVESLGGTVRSASAVREIVVEQRQVRGVVLSNGERVEAETVISAVPPSELERMLRRTAAMGVTLPPQQALEWSPIVNVHLWLDRPVLDDDFWVAVEAPIQTAFDVTRLRPPAGEARYHHIVISQSAAADWQDASNEQILDRCLHALRPLAPRVRSAHLVHARVIRHPRATFIPTPGLDRHRPRTVCGIRGLYLAGDWTATGWPSTLEGAVRSGIIAAGRATTEAPIQADTLNQPAAWVE